MYPALKIILKLYFATDLFSTFASTQFTQSTTTYESQLWSTKMFKRVNVSQNGSALQCLAKCYFEYNETCKIVVFEQPFCYFGDILQNGNVSAPISSNFVYGNYGKFQIHFKFLLATLIVICQAAHYLLLLRTL